MFSACAVVLSIAAILEPSPTGMGTHQRLGLPPCGWIMAADLPCPTCGMTTAFAHAANGDIVRSFVTQPLGCVLAILTAMIALVCVQVMITGSRLGATMAGMFNRYVAWTLAASVVAAWVYTMARHKGWM